MNQTFDLLGTQKFDIFTTIFWNCSMFKDYEIGRDLYIKCSATCINNFQKFKIPISISSDLSKPVSDAMATE